jgi:hypothetical protein
MRQNLIKLTAIKDPVVILTTSADVIVTPDEAELGVVSMLLVGVSKNVTVAPSVVTVTGVVVIPVGETTVLVPIMAMVPPDEVVVGIHVLIVAGSGSKVNVVPSVVTVTGVVRWAGSLIVSVPIITMTVSNEVKVKGPVVTVVNSNLGSNVKVSASVVSTSCVENVVGIVKVLTSPNYNHGIAPRNPSASSDIRAL